MHYIIGVDIGTTSTKAIAFRPSGQVEISSYREYPIYRPQADHSEQDPEEVLAAVTYTLGQVLAGLDQSQVLGISFSCAMHGLMAVDAAGQPLTRCLIWADNRSQAQAEALQPSASGQDICYHTGTPIHPMSPLCKLLWMREHQPGLLARAHKFISLKEYVCYRYFGQYLIDYSLASATGLFDIRQLTWYAPALALAGIRAGQLSTPVSTLHQVGELLPDIARQLGLRRALPFIVGASDGCLANLGSGATKPGQAALTIGTSGAIRVTSPSPGTENQQRLFSYILRPGQYVVGGPVNNGGLILRWFRDQFAADLKQQAQGQNKDPYELLIAQAATVPAGAQGLVFLPYLLGERAPIWDAAARGLFFGVGIHHTRAHFGRAVLEGILMGLYQICRALEENTGPIHEIHAGGGFARSAFWVQLLADIFNKKVILTETVESSAWGAALLGLEALGWQREADLPATPKNQQVFLPQAANHAVYLQNFSIFEQLYPLLKEPMARLQAWQGPGSLHSPQIT
ncbi:MAG: gluconokinase [Adhaeribacter sp.]